MPKSSNLHVDQLLSNISSKYRNLEYIADKISPMIPVKKTSDLYRVFDRNFRIPETLRANKGKARIHDFEVSTASYQLENHALKEYISDDDLDNYDQADLRVDTTEELTDKILMRHEKSMADLFTKTSWSLNHSLAATAEWSENTTVSNPIVAVNTGLSSVLQNAGVAPNYCVLRYDHLLAAKEHVSVTDRVKYTSREIDANIIASLFGVDEVFISKSALDTSNEGLTSTISYLWQNNAFLGYKPSRPSPRVPSSLYTFAKADPMVRRWRDEEREAEAIEVQKKYQHKIVSSLSGYLITGVV